MNCKFSLLRLATIALSAVMALAPLSSEAASTTTPKKKTTTSKTTSGKKSTTKKSSSGTTKKPASRPVSKPAPKPEAALVPAVFNGIPQTNSKSEIVIDAITGRVLHEKNANERRSPASTQKLLTALLVAEAGNLDKPVVIQAVDTLAEPVKLYIKPGEVYTRRQLVQVLLVKSFNDVARALARDNAGSVEAFAVKMNHRAESLGMFNSNFVNPNGLTEPTQFSTARDMAKLARAVYASPVLRPMIATKEMSFRHSSGRISVYKNTNRVLRAYPYCNGMKTGYTMAAGHCLISSGSKGGKEVIVVALGNNRRVWQDSCSLLAWGFTQ